jgi:capsular polysaccharide biosynthesis protein
VDPDLLAAVEEHLPPGPGAVAVLCGSDSRLAEALGSRHPSATVEECDDSLSASDRHVRLTLAGPFDVIVDDHATKVGRRSRFQDAFFQLRAGGAMVVRGARSEVEGRSRRLGILLAKAQATRGEPAPVAGKGTPQGVLDLYALGKALADIAVLGDHLVVRSGTPPPLAKLDESEANSYLVRASCGRDRVVDLTESQPFTSRCVLREYPPESGGTPPAEYHPVDIALREYHHAVVSPGQVVSNERVLWPDTYRHNRARRLRQSYLDEVAPRFARLQHGIDELELLRGAYLHLDNEARGHFGHVITEQVSRMWAWPVAKELVPDLKVVVALNKDREMQAWEYDLLAAAGIDRADVVFLREPVRVERLLSGSPLFSNPHYVHPRIAETWRRVGDNLAAEATDRDYPPRIFCSRRVTLRACHNTDEVEALFAEQGFEIVFPEEFPLGDQVAMFRRAEVVAGFGGSGLFNLCFAAEPKRVVIVRSEAYTARNECLFGSVLGHEIDSIISLPDHPGEFHSAYTFDNEREGKYLATVFASLP